LPRASETATSLWGRLTNVMTSRFGLLPSSDSPLGRFDPRWKLAALLPVMAAFLFLRHPLSLAVGFFGSLLLAYLGRIPARWLLARLGIVSLFLLPFAALLPFLGTGVDPSSWVAILRLYMKSLAVVTLALVLLTMAPPMITLKAARRLRLPSLPLQLFMMTYRYLFVLSQELRRMRIAVRVRGYRPGANRHTYRTTAHLAGTILVRGYEQAERVGQAMRCRGFDGEFHSLARFQTRPADVAFFFLVVGAGAILCIWDYTQA
jgi:cobalt/nickel transport system permease protein